MNRNTIRKKIFVRSIFIPLVIIIAEIRAKKMMENVIIMVKIRYKTGESIIFFLSFRNESNKTILYVSSI